MGSAKFKQDMEDIHQECHLVEQKYKPSSEGKKNRKMSYWPHGLAQTVRVAH